jgi:hypothetical protein
MIIYSYLMGVQAIDQYISHEVLGMTEVFHCPRAIEHFGLTQYRGENCLIYCLHTH